MRFSATSSSVIDTPPSLGLLTINALAAADEVIIPISASLFAMKGLAQLQETIDRVRDSLDSPKLRICGILPTLFDHTKAAKEVVRALYVAATVSRAPPASFWRSAQRYEGWRHCR